MSPDRACLSEKSTGIRPSVERHVVLVSPDVHWNTGNIGRTCIGTGAFLHLIRPLGFSLEDRHLKRAGLDYWPRVRLSVWDNFDAFLDGARPATDEICLFSKTGERSFWSLPAKRRLFLVFGSETRGLPEALRARYPEARYHVPISNAIRSLNLSTAVGIVLYESLRRMPPAHAWLP
jgi:tRNA (cytidine/uridine-2'-O-)-methyltransferase